MKKISLVFVLSVACGTGCTPDDTNQLMDANNNQDASVPFEQKHQVPLTNLVLTADSPIKYCPSSLNQEINTITCNTDNGLPKLDCKYVYSMQEPTSDVRYTNINLEFLLQDYSLIEFSSAPGPETKRCLLKKDSVTFRVNNQDVLVMSGYSSDLKKKFIFSVKKGMVDIGIDLNSICNANRDGGCDIGKWRLTGFNYYLD